MGEEGNGEVPDNVHPIRRRDEGPTAADPEMLAARRIEFEEATINTVSVRLDGWHTYSVSGLDPYGHVRFIDAAGDATLDEVFAVMDEEPTPDE